MDRWMMNGWIERGDNYTDEFLQIRNILPKGPAHQDGVLQTGKGLVDG